MTGRVLALDVGTRRLGVAVSDPSGTVASPLATILRRAAATDAVALAALAAEQGATTVVAGLPVTMAGAEGLAIGPSGPTFGRALRPLLPGWPSSSSTSAFSTVAAERVPHGGSAGTAARWSTRSRPACSSRPGWTAAEGPAREPEGSGRRGPGTPKGCPLVGQLFQLGALDESGRAVAGALAPAAPGRPGHGGAAGRGRDGGVPGPPVERGQGEEGDPARPGGDHHRQQRPEQRRDRPALREAGVVDSVNRFRDVAEERGLTACSSRANTGWSPA